VRRRLRLARPGIEVSMALHKSYPVASFKPLDDDEAGGTFEAIVSVFGNVDLVGDRVVKGAFKSSLKRWRESDDPIPVIWSHQWDNLDATSASWSPPRSATRGCGSRRVGP
jgi:Caudovirus prohead serine protease